MDGTDDEFDYGDSPADTGRGKTLLVPNQHHDEAIELSDDGSRGSAPSPTPPGQLRNLAPPPPMSAATSQSSISRESKSPGDDGSDFHDDDDDDDDNALFDSPPTVYNPAEFANLQVSSEIQDLFAYIGRYEAHVIDLDTPLAPFIPDYIPAVGDIDSFIKIPRPDGKFDQLGLVTLDEPGKHQTDPTVLDLQLRVLSKQSSSATAVTVRSIENADKYPKNITAWITSIQDLHRQKPPPTVSYSRPMPDIDELMQLWPADFEKVLGEVGMPGADLQLDLDLQQVARIACALLDIPVHLSLKESLHVLFILLIEFKENQNIGSDNAMAPVKLLGEEHLDRFESPTFDG